MCLHRDGAQRSETRQQDARPDGGAGRGVSNRGTGRGTGPGWRSSRALSFRASQLKPFTYSIMHLVVAVSVAFALTRDWRIALGVGIIEPMVQTVAYTLHEAAWARGLKRNRTEAQS